MLKFNASDYFDDIPSMHYIFGYEDGAGSKKSLDNNHSYKEAYERGWEDGVADANASS